MNAVRTHDGTRIAFTRAGDGPALILVDGALCHRSFGPMASLAEQLADRFTVYTYDRRGRGESGDTQPYAVEREISDLDALIQEAGGSASVYGASSGAVLALEGAAKGLTIDKLALYEPPLIVDGSRPPLPDEYVPTLDRLIASDRRGDAVTQFMRVVEVPGFAIAMMRLMPAWRKLKAVAHTLPYDAALTAGYQRGDPLPRDRWSSVTTPALVMRGSRSHPWMHNGVQAVADLLPNARLQTLDGQNHMVKAKVQAPILAEFFAG